MRASMRVWVTGAAGFVGRALVRRLAERGDDVVAITRPRSAHRVDRTRARLAVCDLPDLAALTKEPEPDAIVHSAAEIYGATDDSARRVHVDATVALRERAPHARFVLLSSIDVYSVWTHPTPLDESSPTAPWATYGRTKLQGEQAVRGRAVILRPPGVYGPWSHGDGVLDVVRKVARGRFFHVGDGTAKRSWVHVETLVDAVLHAFSLPNEIYNVDDGEPIGRADLAERIARLLGVSPRFPRVSVPVARAVARVLEATLPFASPFTLDSVRYRSEPFVLDTSKLRRSGFVPGRSLDGAIEDTVRWATLTL